MNYFEPIKALIDHAVLACKKYKGVKVRLGIPVELMPYASKYMKDKNITEFELYDLEEDINKDTKQGE